MVNTNDKTAQQKAKDNTYFRRQLKETEVSRARGVGAAYDYLQRHGERSATLSPFCDFIVGSVIVAGLLGLGIYLKNRQDGELRLVNPRDSYSLPAPEHVADKLEGKALEDYKRDLESDEILGIARQYATARKQAQSEHYTNKFEVKPYRVKFGNSLSGIAGCNRTQWNTYRTMDEIIELNNAIFTGEGIEMLAGRYGITPEQMKQYADKIPRKSMRMIDNPDDIWCEQVIPIPVFH